MKKIALVVAIAITSLFALQSGAQADIITSRTVCHGYSNDAGGKSVTVCAKLGFDNQHYWARTTFDNLTGQALPYAISSFNARGAVLWSRATQQSGYCEGKYSSCNGGGNGNWLQTNLQNSQTPYTYDSDHYLFTEHKCWFHGEADVFIYWTQNDYNNLNYEAHSFNTDTVNGEGDYDSRPNCSGG